MAKIDPAPAEELRRLMEGSTPEPLGIQHRTENPAQHLREYRARLMAAYFSGLLEVAASPALIRALALEGSDR
jgi:hypothetical protein